MNYYSNIEEENKPRYVIISNFEIWRIYQEEKLIAEFHITDIKDYLHYFEFIREEGFYNGAIEAYEQDKSKQFELTTNASAIITNFFNSIIESGYPKNDAINFTFRSIAILYWEDCNILQERDSFVNLIYSSDPSGKGLGLKINDCFEMIKRVGNDRTYFKSYPYDDLFAEPIQILEFNNKTKKTFDMLCKYEWRTIRPQIIGSIFQGLMPEEERHSQGAHFTSIENIHKVIDPLFLDEFYERSKSQNVDELRNFHKELSETYFLDPACGSGNFLFTTFEEIKDIEKRIIRITKDEEKIELSQFYGFELSYVGSQLARFALKISYHQMTNTWPKKTARIINDNALRLDWSQYPSNKHLSYIYGNPPFVSVAGRVRMSKSQIEDMHSLFINYKRLDYATAWFKKADNYIKEVNDKCKCAFVATHGIIQPTSASILWKQMNSKIIFNEPPFKWSNESSKEAQVFVVVIGFAKESNVQIRPTFKKYELKKIKRSIGFKHDFKRSSATSQHPHLCKINDILLHRKFGYKKRIPIHLHQTQHTEEVIIYSDGTFFEYAIFVSNVMDIWHREFTPITKGMFSLSPEVFKCFPIPDISEENKQRIATLGEDYYNNPTETKLTEINENINSLYNFNNLSDEQKLDRLYELYRNKISN
jgi:hypothetical protein